MSEQTVRQLFDRWERVWHDAEHDLVGACVAPVYIRHDEAGTRRVTPSDYALEITAAQRDRPNTRFVVYDHVLGADRAWFRFTLKWDDAASGEKRTRAGMQVYRIEDGKLAETWLTLLGLGSSWPDAVAQERWTSIRSPAAGADGS
jgi:hypothetical protein